MKRKLKVDLGELALALANDSYEMRYYLDLETGKILLVTDESARLLEDIYDEIYDGEDNRVVSLEAYLDDHDLYKWQKEELLEADKVEQGYGSRYIRVEQDDPHADYNDMESFIWTVEDEELAARLSRAIQGRGAFRRFRDVVFEDPDVLDAWYAFKDECEQQRLEEWLEANDIEPIT
ncbi:MAG: UPF0158 family protein [Anaerolineae bacterium]